MTRRRCARPSVSSLVVREDLAHRPRRRGVQVRAGGLQDLLLEPAVEVVLRGRELLEGAADVVPGEVDDVQGALRALLDRPDLLDQAQALFRSGVLALALALQVAEEGARGLGLVREDRQREQGLVHDGPSLLAYAGQPLSDAAYARARCARSGV